VFLIILAKQSRVASGPIPPRMPIVFSFTESPHALTKLNSQI
jgi:hypothetical protein